MSVDLFKSLLENTYEDQEDVERCLITKEPLLEDYVQLPCGHKFNYHALCKSLIYLYNCERFRPFFKNCPYCRTTYTGTIAYRQYEDIPKIHGVNWPPKRNFTTNQCKNSKCKKSIIYEYPIGSTNYYCINHYKKALQNDTKEKCKCILKSGKRKGEPCDATAFSNGLCKRHFKTSS